MDWQIIKGARKTLSQETGTVYKDWGGRLPIALIYPNSYFVGMSNLGFQTIYRLFNSHDQVVCERAFYEKSLPGITVESQRRLTDFPIIAFSISYELDYYNVVRILKDNGIPPFAAERDEHHPLIIAGGPCPSTNPEPLAPFFDAFVIGEGEVVTTSLVDTLVATVHEPRGVLLRELAHLPGLYVPALHKATINGQETRVQRQWARSLDDVPVTSVVLTPRTELGDLYLIEIARGCSRACRFCLAGYSFRPFRSRSLDNLIQQAKEGLKYRRRLGLLGAAVSDHPQLEELTAELRALGAGISFSSLRAEKITDSILEALKASHTNTIAIAPETGSYQLRQHINKRLTEDQILSAVEKIAEYKLKQLKLYFMVGLPRETEADIDELIRLAIVCKNVINSKRANTQIILNISPFVPKANTPFQWLPMAPPAVLTERLARIDNSLRPHNIAMSGENTEWSLIQGLLSRGDSQIGQVLPRLDRNTISSWRRALSELDVDLESHVQRRIPQQEPLPWSIIDSGIEPKYLARELKRAEGGLKTPPCPSQKCHLCGVC